MESADRRRDVVPGGAGGHEYRAGRRRIYAAAVGRLAQRRGGERLSLRLESVRSDGGDLQLLAGPGIAGICGASVRACGERAFHLVDADAGSLPRSAVQRAEKWIGVSVANTGILRGLSAIHDWAGDDEHQSIQPLESWL